MFSYNIDTLNTYKAIHVLVVVIKLQYIIRHTFVIEILQFTYRIGLNLILRRF